jgi:hypothetical protein
VGPIVGLNAVEEKKILLPTGIEPRFLGWPTSNLIQKFTPKHSVELGKSCEFWKVDPWKTRKERVDDDNNTNSLG